MLASAEAEHVIFIFVLMARSLLNIAYLMPVVARGFFAEPKPDVHGSDHHDDLHDEQAHSVWHGLRFGAVREAPPFCLFAMAITSVGCIALFFYADKIFRLLAPIAGIKG